MHCLMFQHSQVSSESTSKLDHLEEETIPHHKDPEYGLTTVEGKIVLKFNLF